MFPVSPYVHTVLISLWVTHRTAMMSLVYYLMSATICLCPCCTTPLPVPSTHPTNKLWFTGFHRSSASFLRFTLSSCTVSVNILVQLILCKHSHKDSLQTCLNYSEATRKCGQFSHLRFLPCLSSKKYRKQKHKAVFSPEFILQLNVLRMSM